MADVAAGERNLLTSKWGPLPVWAWSGIGLVAAWLFAKWRDSRAPKKQDAGQDTGTADAAQSEAVAPQFIIENNMPAMPAGVGAPTTPSAPVTLPAPVPPVVTPPGTGPHPPTPGPHKPTPTTPKKPTAYKVKHGDTLSAIAKRNGTTWQALWEYNTTPGNRPASTIATLKKRGPNLLFAGETILIPEK